MSITETPAAYHATLIKYLYENKQIPIGWRWDKVYTRLLELGEIKQAINDYESKREAAITWAREYCLNLQQKKVA